MTIKRYDGAYDTAYLEKLEPVLSLALASKHRNVKNIAVS